MEMSDKDSERRIGGLSWHAAGDVQTSSKMELIAAPPQDISSLLVSNISKDKFENAAEVLISIEYSRIEGKLPEIMEWLQDRNWPGAGTIFDFLVPLTNIQWAIDLAKQKASEQRDFVWLENLDALVEKRGKL